MSDLICTNLRHTLGNQNYVAVGPLVKQPNTLPFRVVIFKRANEFVVYDEMWVHYEPLPDDLQPHPLKSEFACGSYYPFNNKEDEHQAFLDAYYRFSQRIVSHVETSKSIHRPVAVY